MGWYSICAVGVLSSVDVTSHWKQTDEIILGLFIPRPGKTGTLKDFISTYTGIFINSGDKSPL